MCGRNTPGLFAFIEVGRSDMALQYPRQLRIIRVMRNMPPLALAVLVTALSFTAIHAFGKDKVFSFPRAYHPKTYPAFETHEDEKRSIAADPYDMPEKVV